MSWYYSKVTGHVYEANPPLSTALNATIKVEESAAARGIPQGLFGPFATQQEADSFAQANPSVGGQITQTVTDLPGAINNATRTLAQIFIRGAEIAVGVVLLAIAFNVILKQTTGVDVAGTAMKTGANIGKKVATKGMG